MGKHGNSCAKWLGSPRVNWWFCVQKEFSVFQPLVHCIAHRHTHQHVLLLMVGIPVGAAPPTLTNPCVRASPTLIRFQRLSTLPKKHTSYCRSFPRLGSSQRAFCPTRLSALDKMVEPNTVAPETPTTTTSTQRNPSTPDSVLKAFAGCMPKQEIGAQRFLKVLTCGGVVSD